MAEQPPGLRPFSTASWWTFRIIFFFLLRGGEGGVRGDREGGGRFFIENPRRGGLQEGVGGARGLGGCVQGIWRNWGGGLNIFFGVHHRLQILVRRGIPFSFAKRTASSELWGPISCTLLRAAWQAHQECAPRIGQADLGECQLGALRTPTLPTPCSRIFMILLCIAPPAPRRMKTTLGMDHKDPPVLQPDVWT